MIDLAAIQSAFPQLANITPLKAISGQKDVFRSTLATNTVALKIIKKIGPEQDRAEREIAAVAILRSNYVPRVYEHGQRVIAGEDRYFIIEEFIEGETYRDRLIKQPAQTLHDVLNLGYVLLHACVDFEAAPSHGLVHRDIKPENLIIDNNGKIWIIDFGIVRFLGLPSITPDNRLGMFTLGYGAPEQMRNLKAQINSRADLYSVGIILYESLVGFHPYGAGVRDQFAVWNDMQNVDLQPLIIQGDTGDNLSQFIAALTARFPSRRPQTAVEALQWFLPIYTDLIRP